DGGSCRWLCGWNEWACRDECESTWVRSLARTRIHGQHAPAIMTAASTACAGYCRGGNRPGRGSVGRLLADAGAGATFNSRVETVVGVVEVAGVLGAATFMSAVRASSSVIAAIGSTSPQPIWSLRLLVPTRVALEVSTS